jgi:WhiB family transcriptional regulator, redox-sensing transcriptional regulator
MNATTRRATTGAAMSTNWQTRGACRTQFLPDPDLFHPVGAGPAARRQAEQAKKYCQRCPVLQTCLQWALDTRQDEGVLGGTTEEERRVLHRRRRRYGYRRNAAAHILNNRLEEFLELRARGLELLEIATELGTNVQTVNHVIEQLDAQASVEGMRAA